MIKGIFFKISLLLSFFSISVQLMAQDIQLETKDGQVIENGSTVTIHGEMEDMMIWGQFNSNLYVRNLTEKNQGVYAEMKVVNGNSQICWGGSCVPVMAGNSHTTGLGVVSATSSTSLLIETLVMEPGFMDAVVTCTIEISVWTKDKPDEKITATVTYTNNLLELGYKSLSYVIDGQLYETQVLATGEQIVPIEPIKEGHTFNGWINLPEVMPDEDIIVYGDFTINNYQLTFAIGDSILKTVTYPYGSDVEKIEAPKREGYTFKEWKNLPETMPAKDVTVTGQYNKNSYMVTYMVDGAVYNTQSVLFESELKLLNSPQMSGYTFSGWNCSWETMPAHDIVINGYFTINSYSLTYILDGETFRTETFIYGAAITAPEIPAKEGYTFSGWSEVPATMPAKDIAVRGQYKKNSYTVTYMVDGTVYNTQNVLFESELNLLNSPQMDGYTFSGWNCSWETMPAHDIVINGYFTINSYSLTYILDGEVYKQENKFYGTQVKPIEVPEKEGYTFNGWGEVPATMPSDDLILVGEYIVNKHSVIYYVDGSVYATFDVDYGSTITVIANLIKTGYTFSGWSEVPVTMPDHNVIINGNFMLNKYAVKYMLAGEEYATDSIAYGEEIVLQPSPEREGHTFSGWSDAPITMPANDVVINGVYTVNSYQLTYKVDGKLYTTMTVTYGTPIYPIATPIKDGYIFSGWSEIPETMPAEDVIVIGSFEIDGIEAIVTNDLVDVYTLQGIMFKQQIPTNELKNELPKGIYIINSKKIIIK